MTGDEIQKLGAFTKSYLTIHDLRRILQLSKEEANVYAHRLTRQGYLVRLNKGLYRVFNKYDPLEKVAGDLYYPSYVSFYYILGATGILNQRAYTISLATTRKSKKTVLEGRAVEYKQIKPELFFGYYTTRDGYYEAYPEKALLDQLYVCSLGKDHLDFDELNLVDLQKKRFKEFLKAYPPKTKRLVKREILSRWGTVSITIN